MAADTVGGRLYYHGALVVQNNIQFLLARGQPKETIATLKFSHDGLYVHPNLGPRGIQSRHDSSRYHWLNAKLGISIYHDQWIKWNGKKVLWLSVESWTETLGPYLAR